MELLLHYVWKHRMYSPTSLTTTDGRRVEILDPGQRNQGLGPDFMNAMIKIGGTTWLGNVEIHDKASDWHAHHHDKDPRYENVILHACSIIDAQAITQKGNKLPQVKIEVPKAVSNNYRALLGEDVFPPCHDIIPHINKLTLHSWMTALQIERLEKKTEAINRWVELNDKSWEAAFFTALARGLGFGINSDAFEEWALHIRLLDVARHRDRPFQIEAIFMGQSGLLDIDCIPERYREQTLSDDYYQRLSSEYKFLAHKFRLTPMDGRKWKFQGTHPQNFPYIRLAQLVKLYCDNILNLSKMMECETIEEAHNLLKTRVTDYWQTHYTFGAESAKSEKNLSKSSLDILVLNATVPMLFAYGKFLRKQSLCDKALDFLEKIKGESNSIVKRWAECGLEAKTAGGSQALIQLNREYCAKKDCLRCRIGYEYLKRKETPTKD